MPWKSSGLSVRGRLKAAISTLSRGKFSPSDPCEFVERDFGAHAKNLNISPWNKVWSRLSDVWDILTTKGPIASVHKGWSYASYVMSSALDEAQLMHILHSDGYIKPEATPMPILFYFPTAEEFVNIDDLEVDEGVVVCNRISPCSYEIPEDIRDILVLQDFINFPTIRLEKSNQDYLVTAELLPGMVGRITFGSEVVVGRQMWATKYTKKKNQEMVDRFGIMVGYDTVRGDEYDTFTDIYFLRMVQMYGPTNPSLELGITIMQGWPYTRFKCKIESIESDNSSITVSPYPLTAANEGITYEIPNTTGLPIQIYYDEDWVDLTANIILPLGTPITKAVRCFDLKRDPDLANNFAFPTLEKHHKTVVAFNDDIDIVEVEWEFTGYTGGVAGFTIGDKLTGSTSGAWGYITQSLLDPPDTSVFPPNVTGRVELRRAKGVFEVGETITDEHGATAELTTLGGYSYAIDDQITEDFLERNKRFGADFKTLVWIDHLKPEGEIRTTYTTALPSPRGWIKTNFGNLFSPDLKIKTTWFQPLSSPGGIIDTDYGYVLEHEPGGYIDTDYALLISAPYQSNASSSWGGNLDFTGGDPLPVWYDTNFVVNEIATGVTSEATATITAVSTDGITGTLTLRHVRGIFEDGERIQGETSGDVPADGILY